MNNYLNKQVCVYEKTIYATKPSAKQVKYEGVLTSFNDEFIELDNKLIIFKKYIFSIELM